MTLELPNVWADVYVLCPERTQEAIDRFLDKWAKEFRPQADAYEIPQYADHPRVIYKTVHELVAHLLKEPNEPHAIYMGSPEPALLTEAMLFFTKDGNLIAGLTIRTEDEALTRDYLMQLAQSTGGLWGYVTYEYPPPDTKNEFMQTIRDNQYPKMFDGKIFK